MSLVGKIFVGVITTTCIVIFALALMVLAKHEDWRQVALGHQETIKSLQKDITELVSTNDDLRARLAAEKTANSKAIAALSTAEKKVSDINTPLVADNQKKEIDLQKIIEQMTANNASINESRNVISILSTDLALAHLLRGAYLRDLEMATGKKYEQDSIIQARQADSLERLEMFDKIKTVLAKHSLKPDPALYPQMPRYIVTGIIEKLQKDAGRLLSISIGASDGLNVGHMLEVYRGEKYLGRIQVLTTEPNRAVCEVLPRYRRGTFQVGDRVTSKLVQ